MPEARVIRIHGSVSRPVNFGALWVAYWASLPLLNRVADAVGRMSSPSSLSGLLQIRGSAFVGQTFLSEYIALFDSTS